VFGKMAATMDDLAGGRLGFNIVSAGNKGVEGLKRFDEQVIPPPRKRELRRLPPALVPAPSTASALTHA
jgi:alkanesulfonate monooxygenase SsuD/methylene tetrahydromethanopterin reductase-like flavin-dependent oxidoreductase (luciferase family)